MSGKSQQRFKIKANKYQKNHSTNNILNVNNNMVGRDDQKECLLEDLTTSYFGEPKVIPIVAMGGIGKTTLAKEVYNHGSILCRFDVHAWATLSQQHNRKEVLLSLLRSTINMDDTVKTRGEAELADMLQKSLKRKRYLIVLDDIWSCEVWDGVRRCFPTEDNAGSRILLTTRNNEVACYAGTENLSLRMSFMDQDESWSLFKSEAFSSEALPYEFETVGKQIANECHGLPLTIVVVSGLLKYKREIEDWKSVAKDVTSFIPTKELMRTWMAEGFMKLENDLEGEAEKCLQELVDRCLVLVCKKSLDGTKIRSCKVHDLIYDLCVREIQRENIFIMNDIVHDYSDSKHRYGSSYPVHRQLRDHDNNDCLIRTRSIFSFHLKDSYYGLKSELIHFKLLKVLELRHRVIDNFPVEILNLIWLRYLSLLCLESLDIPPELCRLWNLQTFIVQGLPDRSVILGILNVKKLRIRGRGYESIWDSGVLNNLVHLQQLETLSFIHFFNLLPASAKAFPATLKKLKLERTLQSWSYLNIIAQLPNLEVLKLVDACHGHKWYPNVRGFTRLKLLLIEGNYLKYWKAIDDNFPILERLMIRSCRNLKEIPIEFADIHTLQLIELRECPPKLGESAARIQKEQEDLGNNPVDVCISDPWENSEEYFWLKD
ncbi:hypothetical protein P3S68_008673 [Capsicum galapagoense]